MGDGVYWFEVGTGLPTKQCKSPGVDGIGCSLNDDEETYELCRYYKVCEGDSSCVGGTGEGCLEDHETLTGEEQDFKPVDCKFENECPISD